MSANNDLAKKTVSGVFWKLLENVSTQGMQVVIQIILARLILPEEYGLVGLLGIFISVSDVFIKQGLTTALIQKADADETDFSSVFIANILVSLALYCVLFLIAPYVALFYKVPSLTSIMRVLSLNVVIGGLSAVHNAVLSKNLDFKKSFFRNTSNTLTQGVVGIALAMYGYGAWSVVFSKIAGIIVGPVVLWATVKWRPRPLFSFRQVKQLFSFSSKVLCTNLFNTVFNNIHSLVIGHYFSTADVGYYQRGQQLPQTMMTAIDGSLAEVLYPSFSKLQGDTIALKQALRKSISLSMYVVLPMLFGLLAVSKPLTLFLLTEKWLPSVPFMQLSCIVCMFWPLSHRTHALNAMGLSSVTLKLSLIGKSITLICIFLSVRFGIYALMAGTILSSFINLWITSYYTEKHIGYKKRELAADVLPSLAMAAVMCLVVLLFGQVNLHPFLLLLLQILFGSFFYLLLSVLLKPPPFLFLVQQLSGWIHKVFSKSI